MNRRRTVRTIVITGATDGLGRALASTLAEDDDIRLILHGRNDSRLDILRHELADRPAQVMTVCADLAVMSEVHSLADAVAGLTDEVDVLVNNAGVRYG